MTKSVTARQTEILSFIVSFQNEIGYPPTLREIATQFKMKSTFGVKRHLDALAKKGMIKVENNTSRGITVLSQVALTEAPQNSHSSHSPYREIPIIGTVAAGLPIFALENREGSLIVDSAFLNRSDNVFALKVKGDSMMNAGIYERDYVIVAPDNAPKNNDIVVALIEDEATVKRFERLTNKILLKPENDKYQPIEITSAKDFSILGKVVGVVRWFH